MSQIHGVLSLYAPQDDSFRRSETAAPLPRIDVVRRYLVLFAMVCLGCGGDPQSSPVPDGTCSAAAQPFGTDPDAGESIPDFQLADCSGERVTLDALRCQRNVTLISFGAGWCAPCREEAPALEAAWQELGDRAHIVQVLFQDESSRPATTLFCDRWKQEFDLTLPVYIDPVQNSTELFDVSGTPLNVIVDREGRVLWSQSGKIDDVEGALGMFL